MSNDKGEKFKKDIMEKLKSLMPELEVAMVEDLKELERENGSNE